MPAHELTDIHPGGDRDDPAWTQINLEFVDWNNAAGTVTKHLCARLDAVPGGWWYVRKHPHWRVRYARCDAAVERAIHDSLDHLGDSDLLRAWHPTIYEPELVAFGGPSAMLVAHELFCRDSRTALDLLASATGRRRDQAGRIELSLLVISRMLRAAGLDRYEQGDVWARVADSRSAPATASGSAGTTTRAAVHRLVTLDTGPASTLVTNGPLRPHQALLTAFDDTGARLAHLHRTGGLSRGLRAVLAHHVIFHWNRHAVPGPHQGTLAALARDDLLSDELDRVTTAYASPR